MILIVILIRVFVGEIDSTKLNDMWFETHIESAFQPCMAWKLSEAFRMFWEDYDSEDLATGLAFENGYT